MNDRHTEFRRHRPYVHGASGGWLADLSAVAVFVIFAGAVIWIFGRVL